MMHYIPYDPVDSVCFTEVVDEVKIDRVNRETQMDRIEQT